MKNQENRECFKCKRTKKLVMKKGSLLITAVFTLALLLSGCGATAEGNGSSAGNQEAEKVRIGLVQLTEHPSLDTIRTSMMEELKNQGMADNIEVDYKNGQGERSNLNSICQTFVGNQKDVIVAIATDAAQAAAASTKEIPIIFSAVTDPVAAKLLLHPEKPEGNVTGTSDAIPVDKIFGLAKTLTPNAKTFGFIYNTSEVNSVSVITEAKKYCEENHLAYREAVVTNAGEVQQAAQSLVGKVDAIFTPIDNTVASAMPILAQVAREAKLPVYTGADSMVEDGGFATCGIDYTVLGKQTAQMIIEVINGKKIAEIPVETMTNDGIIINQTTADALGIQIPEDIKAKARMVEVSR